MTFGREEFIASAMRAEKEAGKSNSRSVLTVLRQAAVASENLLGTPEWDVFLSYLQASIVESAKLRDAYMNDLADPRLVDANEVAKKRMAVIRLNERIQTLSLVISLPADIRKTGHAADEKLKQLNQLDGDKAA